MGRPTRQISATGEPAGRAAHTCSIVPGRLVGSEAAEALVVFGGVDANGAVFGDAHALPLLASGETHPAAWRQLHPAGGPAPSERAVHCACVLRGGLYVVSGWAGGQHLLDDMWALTGTSVGGDALWRAPRPYSRAAPAPREGASLTAIGPGEAMLFGGNTYVDTHTYIYIYILYIYI